MPGDSPTVHEHDMSLSVWFETPQDSRVRQAYMVALDTLRATGFSMRIKGTFDSQMTLAGWAEGTGNKGDLKVMVECHGRAIEVKFYQDVVMVNRQGGQYDFDRYLKAPYLLKLAYRKMRRRLDLAWQAMGLPVMEKRSCGPMRGMSSIVACEQELNRFQRWAAKPVPGPDNARSQAGNRIAENDVVYFCAGGRWVRGTAFHNINNMWWVLMPGEEVRNIACFELNHRADLPATFQGRQVPERLALAQVKKRLERAVRAEAFGEAAKLRQRRDQIEKKLRRMMPTKPVEAIAA